MFKKLGIALSFLSTSVLAATDFTYDGHFVASEYDTVFAIDYYFEVTPDNPSGLVQGGTLALSTHNGQQYIYISHPMGFKDLSYADDNSTSGDYTVGWNNTSGNKKLGGAIGSEFIELSLTNSDGTYNVSFDPEYSSSGPGAGNSVSGGGGASFDFLSTSDYNQSLFTNGLPSWFTTHSPKTLTPAQIGASCVDESSSDPSCYQLADINANKVNGQLIDWDFNWGLEIKLNGDGGGAFFDDIGSINLSDFGYQTGNAVIRLDELHASDPKTASSGKHGQGNCPDGSAASDHEPCFVEVVTPPGPGPGPGPTPVPEPSTLGLFGIAILALVRRQQKLVRTV